METLSERRVDADLTMYKVHSGHITMNKSLCFSAAARNDQMPVPWACADNFNVISFTAVQLCALKLYAHNSN
jgi:hypothetical protein